MCFNRESFTLKCRILVLKTTASWMHSSHFVDTITTHVSPWNTPVLPTQHGGAREGDQGRWGIVWRCKEGLHGRLTPQQRKNSNKKYLPDAISTSRSRSSYMYSFSWKSGSCKIQSHYFTNIWYVAWGK